MSQNISIHVSNDFIFEIDGHGVYSDWKWWDKMFIAIYVIFDSISDFLVSYIISQVAYKL